MDRGGKINLPSIQHIAQIANNTRDHVLGYGFLLTLIFEHFGENYKRRSECKSLMKSTAAPSWGCGFSLAKGEHSTTEHGPRTTFPPVSGSSSGGSFVEALIQDQTRLKTELTDVKGALAEEKELNTKCHKDLLAILAALIAKLSPPPS